MGALRRGMRIIHVLGWYLPDSVGGTEIYVDRLSKSLRQMGHDVFVAAPQSGITSAQSYFYNDIPVFRYPVPSLPSRKEAEGRQAAQGAEQFHQWLKSAEPDVVHFHSYTTGVGLHEMREAKRIGSAIVVTNHLCSVGYICQRGTMMRWGSEPCDGIVSPVKCAACSIQARGVPREIAVGVASTSDLVNRYLPVLPGRLGTLLGMADVIRWNQQRQEEMLELADRFVLLNDWATRVAESNGAPSTKLEVNRLGVPAGLERKQGPHRAPTARPVVIGYLGRIAKLKGVLELALAFREVPRDAPIRLQIWGPANDPEGIATRDELLALIRGDTRIEYKGAIDPAEVPALLRRFDVLCCPSTSFENGPTVALEAQAVGTPVIASSAGAIQEILRDGVDGRLVAAGDWRSLGKVFREIADDPAGTVDTWRAELPPVRTMQDVAIDYDRTYRQVTARTLHTVPTDRS
jgi:glycosyltransferase involved in cell wall biosynthesis